MKKGLHSEFLKTMTQLATAGFGVAAALAWNETIKSFIDHFIMPGSGFRSKLIYAVIVTTAAVVVAYYLGKTTQEAKEDEVNGQSTNKEKD